MSGPSAPTQTLEDRHKCLYTPIRLVDEQAGVGSDVDVDVDVDVSPSCRTMQAQYGVRASDAAIAVGSPVQSAEAGLESEGDCGGDVVVERGKWPGIISVPVAKEDTKPGRENR